MECLNKNSVNFRSFFDSRVIKFYVNDQILNAELTGHCLYFVGSHLAAKMTCSGLDIRRPVSDYRNDLNNRSVIKIVLINKNIQSFRCFQQQTSVWKYQHQLPTLLSCNVSLHMKNGRMISRMQYFRYTSGKKGAIQSESDVFATHRHNRNTLL